MGNDASQSFGLDAAVDQGGGPIALPTEDGSSSEDAGPSEDGSPAEEAGSNAKAPDAALDDGTEDAADTGIRRTRQSDGRSDGRRKWRRNRRHNRRHNCRRDC
jgi:hypothetical protein